VFCSKPDRIKLTRLGDNFSVQDNVQLNGTAAFFGMLKIDMHGGLAVIWADVRQFPWKALQMHTVTWHYCKEQPRRRLNNIMTLEV
jgi:hypothetical protein